MTSALAILSDRAIVTLQQVTDKRLEVEQLIENYAVGAAVLNVGINLGGFIPIPGAGLVSMAAAIAAQAPAVYEPMSREIAAIYGRRPGGGGAVLDGAIDAGLQLAIVDVGTSFVQDIALDILQDVGAGAVLAAVPFFGGFVASVLDARIGYQMTHRVGYTIALYHEYAGEWIGGSRGATYAYVRRTFADAKRQGRSKPHLAELLTRETEVGIKQRQSIGAMVALLARTGLTKAQIREHLLADGIEASLIDEALAAL